MVLPNMFFTFCTIVVGAACAAVAAYYYNQPQAIENHPERIRRRVRTRSLNPEDDCVICIERLGHNVTTARCGHNFHRACFIQLREAFHICPICRGFL